MRLDAVGRKIVSWVAALALVMASLAPTLTLAFASPSGGAWLEVCSAAGLKTVQQGAERTAPDAPGHDLLKHCPACTLHAADGLLPPPATPMALLPLSFERPALFFSAPRTLAVWRTAEARGPPTAA